MTLVQRPGWRENAQARLDRIIAHGDEFGDIANAAGDDLRDILTLFVPRIAEYERVVEAAKHSHRMNRITAALCAALSPFYPEQSRCDPHGVTVTARCSEFGRVGCVQSGAGHLCSPANTASGGSDGA